jgi:hypothetical protein
MALTVEEKDQEIRKNISSLIDELRSVSRSSKLFKEFKDLSYQEQKQEITGNLKNFKKSDVESAFSDMIKEVFKRDAKTEKELLDKRESIKTIREQIKKNVNLFNTDNYQELLNQIELSDVALKEDFDRKYSTYKKLTGFFNKKSLDALAITSALASRSPLLGLGIKATGMAGGMLFSGAKKLFSPSDKTSSIETGIREKTILNLQEKLKNLKGDPVEKTKVKSYRSSAPLKNVMSDNTTPLLEKILYASEETYLETAESKEILSKIYQLQQDQYLENEINRFEDLENEKESRSIQRKLLAAQGGIIDRELDKKVSGLKGSISSITDSVTEISTAMIVAGVALKNATKFLKGGIKFLGKKFPLIGAAMAAGFARETSDEAGVSYGSALLAELGSVGTLGINDLLPESFGVGTSNIAKKIESLRGVGVEKPKNSMIGLSESILKPDQAKLEEMNSLIEDLEKKKKMSSFAPDPFIKVETENKISELQDKILKLQNEMVKDSGLSLSKDISENQKMLSKRISSQQNVLGQPSGNMEIDKLYEAIASAETGGEKDPFIRTRTQDMGKGHSSAFGPVQITYSLAKKHLEKGTFKDDPEMEKYVRKFIEQGKKFIYQSRGEINDSRFALGGKGELTSDEDKENYRKMASRMMEKDLKRVGGDTSQFAKEWRFGVEGAKTERDDRYFAKVDKSMAGIQTASKEDMDVLNRIKSEPNTRPTNVASLSKTNEELKYKQTAKNNVSINNVSHSPPPGTANGPSNSPRVSSVRNTDSTLARIMDKNYRGTAS